MSEKYPDLSGTNFPGAIDTFAKKTDPSSETVLWVQECYAKMAAGDMQGAYDINGFSDLWTKAEQGENLYTPHFYGWIDDKIMFAVEQEQFCKKWKARHGKLPTADDLDAEEKALFERGATIKQIVWRRLKIANSSADEFKQEFPSTPLEAFLTTGQNVFDTKIIKSRSATLPKPVAPPKQFIMAGLKFWALPVPGVRYYIGVDVAEGLGGDCDHSCIEIINGDGYQCAELYTSTIAPYRLAEVLLKLAQFYNGALCVIEKASAGHTVIDKMRNEYAYSSDFRRTPNRRSNVYAGAVFARAGLPRRAAQGFTAQGFYFQRRNL